MSAEPITQHFRGVHCHHCGKPVRVPTFIMKKESVCLGHENSEFPVHLISRVFVLRCRCCERESIYAINQIVDCTCGAQANTGREAQAATV